MAGMKRTPPGNRGGVVITAADSGRIEVVHPSDDHVTIDVRDLDDDRAVVTMTAAQAKVLAAALVSS